jgi:mitochondrial inner membrane protease ATP23
MSTAEATTAKPVREDENESARLCNKWIDSGLTGNKTIQFLVQHLEDLGCVPPDGFIRAISCETTAAGGFGMIEEAVPSSHEISVVASKEQCKVQDLQTLVQREEGPSKLQIKPEIVVCQQYMENETHTHRTIIHELIHAVDMCRTNMDPFRNCVQMACTEIRAGNLSGECSFWKELPRMKKLAKHGQECVRRRAILSVRANPNCAEKAEAYVDATMERCYQDEYPFDRHPNVR